VNGTMHHSNSGESPFHLSPNKEDEKEDIASLAQSGKGGVCLHDVHLVCSHPFSLQVTWWVLSLRHSSSVTGVMEGPEGMAHLEVSSHTVLSFIGANSFAITWFRLNNGNWKGVIE
jgi:hypothetical protein